MEPVTRKKPWNRVSLPVYSVSSLGSKQANMHICTYVSAMSMHPKRMMVAIFKGTQTLENIETNPHFVLQLLHTDQYNLVKLLGKQSGKTVNKIERLHKHKLLTTWQDFPILRQALSVMELKPSFDPLPADTGDHMTYICDVLAWKNLNNGEPLTTQILHEKRIIRI
jgi:flavin reductase (DIM6/NTAB) family NADH-FMN oxidoreductase RutF